MFVCKRVCVLQRLCVKMFVCKRACLTPPEHLFGGWLSSPPFSGIYIIWDLDIFQPYHPYICRSHIFKASHLRTLISSHPYICRSYVRMFLCFACYVVRLRHAVCCLGTVMDDNKKERGKHKRYISIEHIFISLFSSIVAQFVLPFRTYQYIQIYNVCHVCLHARFFLTTFVTLGTSVV